jgi:uncharacterized membrane protein YcjF (UPF0283 family)
MFTIDLIPASAHYDEVSVAAASAPPDDLLSLMAIAVVIMLMGFAVQWLRGIIVALWAMTRLMLSALGVALLVIIATVLAVAAYVLQIRGR